MIKIAMSFVDSSSCRIVDPCIFTIDSREFCCICPLITGHNNRSSAVDLTNAGNHMVRNFLPATGKEAIRFVHDAVTRNGIIVAERGGQPSPKVTKITARHSYVPQTIRAVNQAVAGSPVDRHPITTIVMDIKDDLSSSRSDPRYKCS